MTYRTIPSNLLVAVFLVCLCLVSAAAADDDAGPLSRSFTDVPSWIITDPGIRTPAEGGYLVNEAPSADLGGFSDINRADAARTEADVPSWIPAAAGISGIAVLLLASVKFLPVLIGRTKDVTPSPVRDALLALIREHPGSPAAFLQEETGLHRATLRYHLAVLEKEKQVVTRRTGHSYHYFPNGSTLSYADTIRLTLCQNPTTGKILDIIETEPGISGTVLAARAGITAGTLTWHLGRLEENNLITISRSGRGMQIFPAVHT